MCSDIVSIAGVVLNMFGTILSLWSILGTRTRDIGTAKHHDNQQGNFKKEKRTVIIGISFIIIGSILQILVLLV